MRVNLKDDEIIERLKNVSVRDGFLIYRMFWLKRTTIYELYPAHNRHLLDSEYALADKLHADAFNIYKAKQRRKSAIFKGYLNQVEEKFPEFDSKVVWRYFKRAESYSLEEIYPFDRHDVSKDKIASTCLQMGDYSAAALLDKSRSRFLNALSFEVKIELEDDFLFKLFPHLMQDQEKLQQIQQKIEALDNYCKLIAPDCREEIKEDLQDKKTLLKQQNPGFHSVSYTIAWNCAEASINDWQYMSFDPELENFFAPFEFSPQVKL